MRAAQSLAVHPGIEAVALLGPTKSPHFPTVETPAGWDLIVGLEGAAAAGVRHDLPVAVVAELDDQPGISLGSPVGLALALAVGVDGIRTVAVAIPGAGAGETQVVFPSPIDSRQAEVEIIDGHDVLVARGEGTLAAALALGEQRHRVIVDDSSFLGGVALAAAAVAALAAPLDGPTPVWTRADTYLRACAEMGLVIGERSPTG